MTVSGRAAKTTDPCPHGATLGTCAEDWCKGRAADLRAGHPIQPLEFPESHAEAPSEIRASRQMHSWHDYLGQIDGATVTAPPAWRHQAGAGTCRCGAWWSGEQVCHCPTCHLTFTHVNGFDAHRVGPYDPPGARRCLSEAEFRERGYEPNSRGHWRKPRPADTLPERNDHVFES